MQFCRLGKLFGEVVVNRHFRGCPNKTFQCTTQKFPEYFFSSVVPKRPYQNIRLLFFWTSGTFLWETTERFWGSRYLKDIEKVAQKKEKWVENRKKYGSRSGKGGAVRGGATGRSYREELQGGNMWGGVTVKTARNTQVSNETINARRHYLKAIEKEAQE